MEPQRTLTDLPLEAIDMIFKALERKPYEHGGSMYDHYSPDKLSLALASKYLGKAFACHSRDVYKMVMCEDSIIPERAWPAILSLCGSTAVEYDGSPRCWSVDVAKAVAQYCPNLQKLSFEVGIGNRDILLSVIHNAKSAIRTLNFGYNFSDIEGTDPGIMCHIPELPLLRELTIGPCKIDEAYQIQRFMNIEELYLYSPYDDFPADLKSLNLFKAFAALKKLRVLTVTGIHIISESDENEISPPLSALEHFRLIFCKISMEFPSCPKLKTFDIDSSECDIEGLVRRSVLKQSENLEKLIVDCGPSQFNNNDLLKVIRKFRKLRYINIDIQNITFDLEFVNELVNALRVNGISGTDPLVLDLDANPKVNHLRHWLSHTASSNLIIISVYQKNGY